MLLLVLSAAPAWSATRYVKFDAAGANNGATWGDAFTDLQSALAAALPGDEVWVAAGTYLPSSTGDRTASFVLPAGVVVLGSFNGTETSGGQRNLTTLSTTLSGDLGTTGSYVDNSYHVVKGGAGAILDGFQVRYGNANSTANVEFGGGLLNTAPGLILSNCIFSDNRARLRGAGIHNSGDEMILANCDVANNLLTQNGRGGGVFNDGTSVTLTNSTITGNSGSYGAGVANEGLVFRISGCTVRANTAVELGGGLHCELKSITVDQCLFYDNVASGGGGIYVASSPTAQATIINSYFNGNTAVESYGGGVYSQGNTGITDCIFDGNSASISGGGAQLSQGSGVCVVDLCAFNANSSERGGGVMTNFTNGANMVLSRSTFSENLANTAGGGIYVTFNAVIAACLVVGNESLSLGSGLGAEGGAGIYLSGGSPNLQSCVIAGNAALINGTSGGRGGGLYLRQSNAKLVNCTVAANSATGLGGGGLFITGAPTLFNTIIWQNTAGQGAESYNSGGAPVFTSCLVGGSGGSGAWNSLLGTDGGGNLGVDPLLYDALNPAGFDGILRTADDGLRLRLGSPCLDSALAAQAPIIDIIDAPRQGNPDIGAYEGILRSAASHWQAYP